MSSRFDRLPPLAALRPFEAAARHASFKQAASELCLSQAAISRQIRALEDDLGTALFIRGHRRVTLTDDGQRLAEVVTRGLSELASVAHAMRSRLPDGQILLRIELYLAMYWLVPRLGAFHAVNPDVRIQLAATTAPLSQATDPFDLAIQSADRPTGGFKPLVTAPEAIVPVCTPSFARAGSMSLETLADQPRLSFHQIDEDAWMDWPGWFGEVGWRGPSPPPAEVFDSYPLMIEALLAGYGIGLGWVRGLGDLLERNALVNPVRDSVYQAGGIAVFDGGGIGRSHATARVVQWLEDRLHEPLATMR